MITDRLFLNIEQNLNYFGADTRQNSFNNYSFLYRS